jgi:hypothetical protein
MCPARLIAAKLREPPGFQPMMSFDFAAPSLFQALNDDPARFLGWNCVIDTQEV